ncbi:MAG: NAD(P)H-dependent oxidoreductase [Bacteroidales bacterium]|nr:NAD(P)H-dependent oxidoreductase [Bacteroidales bacterium]MDD3522477.1 NAD(P)H-dependent oxidoreductase [Bacteroidales bacterium]MDD4031174.1 NAD(P)H-dependent oxidoreductase [Bacteroidales bacterium]MDD4435490.1 NAD(P)H-dependent oxidoreductase [Bacteroidales bacterium]MDD5732385.1 NAD(P)H-dependent oxidoreductase [Bacteroidales bacterium]
MDIKERKSIAVLVGSLRKASLNKKLALVMQELAPDTLDLELVQIGNLPLYNEDLEQDTPAEWTEFRQKIAKADGLLFITPEYNRSPSAAMKNALDVGSRPYMKNVWSNKPAAVISLSPGAIGGFGANHHLRQSLVCVNALVMAQPEMYIGAAGDLFDENGKLTDKKMEDLIHKFFRSFNRWLSHFIE